MGISVKARSSSPATTIPGGGIKPKVAAEHGAVGCLIFSDPHEDGFYQGETFPAGPFRPPDGVQRGSVAGHAVLSQATRSRPALALRKTPSA